MNKVLKVELNQTMNKTISTTWVSMVMILLLSIPAKAQTVPKEIQIGDITVQITESGRKQIQGDVDRLTRSQTYHQILVDRMNLYFPIIAEEFEKAGVPKEIMFLSIQESALISDAVSSANAVGFWQFKDFTAREMGLKVDRFVDERQSIRSASKAAAKYLNSNNFYFKNWIYAVLAYQAGPTGAKQHVNENDFGAKKMTITPRSYWYVKKFIAHVVAFSPSLGTVPHSEKIWLEELNNKKGKTLEQISKEEKVSLDELKKYNKWLKGTRVPSDKIYAVYVPREGTPPKKAIAKSLNTQVNNDITSEKGIPRVTTDQGVVKRLPNELAPGITNSNSHTIIEINRVQAVLAKKNDDIQTLSARGGISEQTFRRYNELKANEQIVTDKFYYIRKKKSKSAIGFHVVKANESLWDISQQYGMRMNKVASLNRMSIIDELKPGRVLWLNKKRPKKVDIAYHQLKDVENAISDLSIIKIEKKKIKPSPKANQPANTSHDEFSEKIDPGPIRVPVVDSSDELKKVKIHTVAKGESLWSIKQKYHLEMDDLLRWNELENPNQLKIGQNILVKAPINEVSKKENIISHKVAPGETVYSISRKYKMTVDEVTDLNGLENFAIDVGQVLKVFDRK